MRPFGCVLMGVTIFSGAVAAAQSDSVSTQTQAIIGERVFVNDSYGVHLGCDNLYDLNNYYGALADSANAPAASGDDLDALHAAFVDGCVPLDSGDTGLMINTLTQAVGGGPTLIQYDKIRMDSSGESYWLDAAYVSPIVVPAP